MTIVDNIVDPILLEVEKSINENTKTVIVTPFYDLYVICYTVPILFE